MDHSRQPAPAFPAGLRGRSAGVVWYRPCRRDACGCVSGVCPTARRDPDRCVGALDGRGRSSGHRPARASVQRHPTARDHALQDGSRTVVDRADLRAWHRPYARTAAGAGALGAGAAAAAQRSAPAGRAPTAVRDQPRHEGRVVVEHVIADRDVRALPLEDQATADERAWRGERGRVGPAQAPGAGPSRS